MKQILKNLLALLVGLFVGGLVNMGIVMLAPTIIAPPAGVDVTNMESLKANMHLFETKHFVFPFLAHALGTLVGALVAVRLASTRKRTMGLAVGIFFLAGGISNIVLLPSPLWFAVLDLVFAYIPMGLLGYWLYTKMHSSPVAISSESLNN